MADLTPTPPQQRIASLDLVRGFAVIGIAFMNVAAFAMPFAAYDDPRAWGGQGLADHLAWAFDFVLVDGKMRALFSALFGASLLLVIDRAEAAGRSGIATHYRRMAWLLAIGILHGTLIWFGDILALYAIVGSVAVLKRNAPTHELVVLAALALAAPILWDALAWDLGTRITVDVRAIGADLALHHAGYGAITADRLRTEGGVLLDEVQGSGLDTLGLMFAGMAALRSGFATGAWPRGAYRRTAAWCYAIGLPALAATAAALWHGGFDGGLLYGAVFVIGAVARPLVALGHAALLIGWTAERAAPLRARLAGAGRMALSNYLLTSIIGTTLCYGYGFDLFGRLDRVAQLALAGLNGVLILAWSKPWLARFRYGPAEWAWRSLAQWRLQPMRRG